VRQPHVFAAGHGGEHEFSELLGSDVHSLISGVSFGTRDWRHVTE
jgi:hypothetical protein